MEDSKTITAEDLERVRLCLDALIAQRDEFAWALVEAQNDAMGVTVWTTEDGDRWAAALTVARGLVTP